VVQILAVLQGDPCKLQVTIMMLQSMSMVRKSITKDCVTEMVVNFGIHMTVDMVDDNQLINLVFLGLLNEPKWGHLKDLHAALKLCEPALVAADSPTHIKLGSKQEVWAKPEIVINLLFYFILVNANVMEEIIRFEPSLK